jgi:hypothetical protein
VALAKPLRSRLTPLAGPRLLRRVVVANSVLPVSMYVFNVVDSVTLEAESIIDTKPSGLRLGPKSVSVNSMVSVEATAPASVVTVELRIIFGYALVPVIGFEVPVSTTTLNVPTSVHFSVRYFDDRAGKGVGKLQL